MPNACLRCSDREPHKVVTRPQAPFSWYTRDDQKYLRDVIQRTASSAGLPRRQAF